MPEYEERVAFVDTVTTDVRSESVLNRYSTSYIPTSVFVDGAGNVRETFIGPMSAEDLRGRLDALVRE